MKKAIIIVALLVAVLLGIPQASADTNANPIITVRITAIQDTIINQASPSTNYCTTSGAQVIGTGAGTTARTLFQFSIADIPSNAMIVEAKFNAFISQVSMQSSNGLGTLQFYQLSSAWSVCTVTWNNQPTQLSPLGFQYISNATVIQPLPFPFDITQFIVNWQASPSSNNGIEAAFQTDTSAPLRILSWFSTQGGVQKPFVTVSYRLPTATIYPAYYCSGGPCETGILSGSGLPAYLFNVSYAENNGTYRRAPRADILLSNVSTYYTLRVADFFGNLLYNQSKVVTSSTFLWIVSIPYGIFQVYSMRDTFTSLSIKPTGGTAMLIDIPPRAWWALPLKTGLSYFLNFTLLDVNFQSVATINIVRTMGQKLSFIVNGTTLSQVSANQNGNWVVTNETKGLLGGIGNVLLAPKGLDFFKDLTGLPMFLFLIPFGTNIWTFLLIATVIAGVFFLQVYRKRLNRNVARWPLNMRVAATVLVVLGFLLFLSAVLYMTTGSFVIPFPISNA